MNLLPTRSAAVHLDRIKARSATAGPLLALAVLLASACASYEETKVAFDSLAGMDPSSLTEPQEASYSDKALMHGWATETFAFGSDGVMGAYGAIFGAERSSSDVDAPDEFVRESLTTLVDLAGQDTVRLSESAYRVSYVLSKDPRSLSRSIATELACVLLQRLETEPVQPDHQGLKKSQSQTYLDEAKVIHQRIQPWWPGIRPKGPLSASDQEEFLSALWSLAKLPAATSEQERLRLQFFLELFRLESRQPGLEAAVERILISSLRSALLHGIADGLVDPDPHTRETAIAQLWRLGGRGLFPWVLAQLEKTRADPMSRVLDPSPNVRRRLMQCIWSMDLEAAEQRYGKSGSSLEYLHTAAIWDPERHLKFLATECLAHLLDRPNEIGSHWVRPWWAEYVTRAKKATGSSD